MTRPSDAPARDETPTPGSAAAVARGCRCPVLDNARGRGAYGSAGLFWRAADCPVHATREVTHGNQ